MPIVAGLDKFTNVLTDWKMCLSPVATRVVPVSPKNFMCGVGVVEVAAGIRRTTRVGAYVVGGWRGRTTTSPCATS